MRSACMLSVMGWVCVGKRARRARHCTKTQGGIDSFCVANVLEMCRVGVPLFYDARIRIILNWAAGLQHRLKETRCFEGWYLPGAGVFLRHIKSQKMRVRAGEGHFAAAVLQNPFAPVCSTCVLQFALLWPGVFGLTG